MGENPKKNTNSENRSNGSIAGQILAILIQQIKVTHFGCRTVEEDLTVLTESIQRHGLLHYPTVVPDSNDKDSCILIAGRRRLTAVKELGWDRILCHVRSPDEYEGRFVSFTENSQRQDPHPIDQAGDLLAIKQLTGMPEAEIGKEVGLSQESVSEHIGILDLPEDIQQMIGTQPESAIKYSHAVRLSKLMRTNRFYREVEVHKLANKTTTCALSSAQLGDHVSFIKGERGEFDCLPDRLKDLFFEDKWMRPFLGRLFVRPKDFMPENVSNAESLRKKADRLTRKQLERFVLNAVERRWADHEVIYRLT